jgi:hypothetical protein
MLLPLTLNEQLVSIFGFSPQLQDHRVNPMKFINSGCQELRNDREIVERISNGNIRQSRISLSKLINKPVLHESMNVIPSPLRAPDYHTPALQPLTESHDHFL